MKKIYNINMDFFIRLLLLLMLFSSILLIECTVTSSQGGGGNDFPNSALGKTVANYLSKGDNWSDSILLPKVSSPLSIAQTISIPSLPEQTLRKERASNITIRLDLSDTSKGIVGLYIGVSTDTLIKNDTFIVLYDSMFRDSIKNNENLFMVKSSYFNTQNQHKITYLLIDSDGDSIINNRDGKPNRLFVSKIISISDTISKIEIELDGGQDNDLSTKNDIRILKCSILKLYKEKDTLSMLEYKNYSAGSILFDLSQTDSFFVKTKIVDTDMFGQKTNAEAIFLIFADDSSKNKLLFFNGTKILNNGNKNHYLVKGQGKDSLLKPLDTALAYIIVDSLPAEENIDTLKIIIKTGDNPSDLDADSLIGLYYSKYRKTSEENITVFSFTSYQPVPKGEKLMKGTFDLKITYIDNQWLFLNGSFTPENIIAHFVDSKGNSGELLWNRQGELLK